MRSDLDHLPEKQQEELARVRTILLDEFEAAKKQGSGGTSEWRRNGQVLKIILFGSYARSDWVDEPQNGYLSDFDLLIVVSHPKLTDIADYWYVAEDRILRDPSIGRTVNIIVHTLTEVNQGIERGEYFWTDIARDGVTLYELPGHPLATPRPISPEAGLAMARAYRDNWLPKVESAIKGAAFYAQEGELRDAAFSLHQAVERAYICFLLVSTLYFPRSHNIKFLRSLAEDVDPALAAAWPRDDRDARRRFELLKRAYVEARYSDQFTVSVEDISALRNAAGELLQIVRRLTGDRVQSR
ncbi:MAG: HEPN domain-containing protein [Brevundimonas sp.]